MHGYGVGPFRWANLRTRMLDSALGPNWGGRPFFHNQERTTIVSKSNITKQQRDRLRRQKTSFGVLFVRSRAITQVSNSKGELVSAKDPGSLVTTSVRRFGTSAEARHHGKRFARIEKHTAFHVIFVEKGPNAYVNFKTGKTNPLIGRKRTNRK